MLQLTIEATEKLTNLDGVPVRIWKGRTPRGIEVLVFVHRIAVHESSDATELERELKAQLPPGQVFDLRHVL